MVERICSIEGCDRKSRARGWCNLHWRRWRNHGDPLYTPPDDETRFWSRVDRRNRVAVGTGPLASLAVATDSSLFLRYEEVRSARIVWLTSGWSDRYQKVSSLITPVTIGGVSTRTIFGQSLLSRTTRTVSA